MPNTLDDLRAHLFATLDALRAKDDPMDIERARAISEVAQTVIASAKAEVDYVRALGREDLELPVFGALEEKPQETPATRAALTVRTHRLRG